MCVSAGNCFSEGVEILSRLGFPLLILDEVGHAAHSTFKPNAQMQIKISSCSTSVLLNHDLVEDG